MAFKMSGPTPFNKIISEADERKEIALQNLKFQKKKNIKNASNWGEKRLIRKEYRIDKKGIKSKY